MIAKEDLAVDGKAGRTISEIEKYFVHANVKAFPYADVDAAIVSAAGERVAVKGALSNA